MRAEISLTVISLRRAAASSMARGIPSTVRTISWTLSRSDASSWSPGRWCRARSTNSSTPDGAAHGPPAPEGLAGRVEPLAAGDEEGGLPATLQPSLQLSSVLGHLFEVVEDHEAAPPARDRVAELLHRVPPSQRHPQRTGRGGGDSVSVLRVGQIAEPRATRPALDALPRVAHRETA